MTESKLEQRLASAERRLLILQKHIAELKKMAEGRQDES